MSLPLRLLVQRTLNKTQLLQHQRGLAVASGSQATGTDQKLYKVRDALNQALFEEIERDENVIVIGEFSNLIKNSSNSGIISI